MASMPPRWGLRRHKKTPGSLSAWKNQIRIERIISGVGGIGHETMASMPPRWGLRWHKKTPGLLSAWKNQIRIERIISGVGGIGLEPTTFAMSTQRSNQLS